jgi:hypothetical protein
LLHRLQREPRIQLEDGMALSAALAQRARGELMIIRAFRAEGAVSGPTAQGLRALGLKDSSVLRHMIAAAVVRKAGPERFFLDEAAWAARPHGPKLSLRMAAAVGLGLLVLLTLLYAISR